MSSRRSKKSVYAERVIVDQTRDYCKDDLVTLKKDDADANALLTWLTEWANEPLSASKWIEALEDLGKRGFPFATSSQLVAKTYFQQRVRSHILFDKVSLGNQYMFPNRIP